MSWCLEVEEDHPEAGTLVQVDDGHQFGNRGGTLHTPIPDTQADVIRRGRLGWLDARAQPGQ